MAPKESFVKKMGNNTLILVQKLLGWTDVTDTVVPEETLIVPKGYWGVIFQAPLLAGDKGALTVSKAVDKGHYPNWRGRKIVLLPKVTDLRFQAIGTKGEKTPVSLRGGSPAAVDCQFRIRFTDLTTCDNQYLEEFFDLLGGTWDKSRFDDNVMKVVNSELNQIIKKISPDQLMDDKEKAETVIQEAVRKKISDIMLKILADLRQKDPASSALVRKAFEKFNQTLNPTDSNDDPAKEDLDDRVKRDLLSRLADLKKNENYAWLRIVNFDILSMEVDLPEDITDAASQSRAEAIRVDARTKAINALVRELPASVEGDDIARIVEAVLDKPSSNRDVQLHGGGKRSK